MRLFSPWVGLSLQTLILLWVAAAEEFFLPPHLPSEPTESFDQSSSRSWIPGRTTKLAFLKPDSPFKVHVQVLGRAKYGAPKFYSLEYKCDSREPAYQQVKLRDYHQATSYIHPVWTRSCNDYRHFQLKSLSEEQFELVLSSNWSSVPFSESFTLLLELRLRVEYPMNHMTSASLFISNFDAVLSMNSKPEASAGLVYTRSILTQEAVEFLAGLSSANFTPSNAVVVKFLDKSFVELLKNASKFIQSLLSVSIRFEDVGCRLEPQSTNSKAGSSTATPLTTQTQTAITSTFMTSTSILHSTLPSTSSAISTSLLSSTSSSKNPGVNSTRKFAATGVTPTMDSSTSHSTIPNGKACLEALVLSSRFEKESEGNIFLPNGNFYALHSILHRLNAFYRRRVRLSIELSISEAANYAAYQNYTVSKTVMEYVHRGFYRKAARTSKIAAISLNVTRVKYIYFQKGNVSFSSPIICSNKAYHNFKLFINNKFCSRQKLHNSDKCKLAKISDDYRSVTIDAFSQSVMQLKTLEFKVSRHVENPGAFNSKFKHSRYKFKIFPVQVPRFATPWERSSLPKVINYMRNMPVSFRCTVHSHVPFDSVNVEPMFEVPPDWKRVTLDVFAAYLEVEPNEIKKIDYKEGSKFQLTVQLPAVLERWAGYNFVFVCLAEIKQHTGIGILGIPSYSTETSSFVSFSGRSLIKKLASRQCIQQTLTAACLTLWRLLLLLKDA